jgi:hypothetical protein
VPVWVKLSALLSSLLLTPVVFPLLLLQPAKANSRAAAITEHKK